MIYNLPKSESGPYEQVFPYGQMDYDSKALSIRTLMTCITISLQQNLSELMKNRKEKCDVITEKMVEFERLAYLECDFCFRSDAWDYSIEVINKSINIFNNSNIQTNTSHSLSMFQLIHGCANATEKRKSVEYYEEVIETFLNFKKIFGDFFKNKTNPQLNVENEISKIVVMAEEALSPMSICHALREYVLNTLKIRVTCNYAYFFLFIYLFIFIVGPLLGGIILHCCKGCMNYCCKGCMNSCLEKSCECCMGCGCMNCCCKDCMNSCLEKARSRKQRADEEKLPEIDGERFLHQTKILRNARFRSVEIKFIK